MTQSQSHSRSNGSVFSSVRPLSRVQIVLLGLALIGFVLDAVSTRVVVSSTYARELNPVMRFMMSAVGLTLGVVVTKVLAVASIPVALAAFPPEWRNLVFTLAVGAISIVGIGMGLWNVLLLTTM